MNCDHSDGGRNVGATITQMRTLTLWSTGDTSAWLRSALGWTDRWVGGGLGCDMAAGTNELIMFGLIIVLSDIC